MSGPREPSPAPAAIEPEIVEAAAADLDDVIAAFRVQVQNLENVATLLRREAAEARK